MTQPSHSPPTRKPHWWKDLGAGGQVTLILAVVLAPLLIGGLLLTRSSSSGSEIDVTLTKCTFTGGEFLPSATVEFTARNPGGRAETVTLRWEYRDSSGARVDTDSTRVEVPAGDTIRAEETTLLDATVSSGRCTLVGVR